MEVNGIYVSNTSNSRYLEYVLVERAMHRIGDIDHGIFPTYEAALERAEAIINNRKECCRWHASRGYGYEYSDADEARDRSRFRVLHQHNGILFNELAEKAQRF